MLKAIVRMGKAVQSMSDALHHFNNEDVNDHRSGAHRLTQRFEAGDLSKIVHDIHKTRQTFLVVTTLFPSITCNMFKSIDQPKFQEWMDTKFAKTVS